MIELEILKILRFTGEKMKINAKTLSAYFKTCGLGDTIHSIKTEFKNGYVFTSMKNRSNTIFINTKLNSGVFENYESIGTIIIRNLRAIIKYLDSFKNTDVDFSKSEDLFISNDKKEYVVILGGENVVEDQTHTGELLNIENCSIVEVDYNDLLDASNLITDLCSESLVFEKKEDLLVMYVDNGDSSDKSKIKIPCDDKSINKTIIGKPFLDAIKVFDKKFPVTVELGTDAPITFKQVTDIMDISVIVAPRVEND